MNCTILGQDLPRTLYVTDLGDDEILSRDGAAMDYFAEVSVVYSLAGIWTL